MKKRQTYFLIIKKNPLRAVWLFADFPIHDSLPISKIN